MRTVDVGKAQMDMLFVSYFMALVVFWPMVFVAIDKRQVVALI